MLLCADIAFSIVRSSDLWEKSFTNGTATDVINAPVLEDNLENEELVGIKLLLGGSAKGVQCREILSPSKNMIHDGHSSRGGARLWDGTHAFGRIMPTPRGYDYRESTETSPSYSFGNAWGKRFPPPCLCGTDRLRRMQNRKEERSALSSTLYGI